MTINIQWYKYKYQNMVEKSQCRVICKDVKKGQKISIIVVYKSSTYDKKVIENLLKLH